MKKNRTQHPGSTQHRTGDLDKDLYDSIRNVLAHPEKEEASAGLAGTVAGKLKNILPCPAPQPLKLAPGQIWSTSPVSKDRTGQVVTSVPMGVPVLITSVCGTGKSLQTLIHVMPTSPDIEFVMPGETVVLSEDNPLGRAVLVEIFNERPMLAGNLTTYWGTVSGSDLKRIRANHKKFLACGETRPYDAPYRDWRENEVLLTEYLSPPLPTHGVSSVDTDEENMRLKWAASTEESGAIGQALGVVIDISEGIGALVECSAFIEAREKTRGKLDILGRQIEGIDNGYLIEKPLDYLEEKLSKGLFRGCPILKAYHLDRFNINVDLKERVISHARSLSLSIVMAIVNAVHRRSDPLFLYAADLRQDGKLQQVGHMALKLKTALENGVRHIVLAEENRKEVPAEFLDHPDLELLFFDTLTDVLTHFGLQPRTCPQAPKPAVECSDRMTATSTPDMTPILDKLSMDPGRRELWARLLSFFGVLCQTGEFQEELSTAFLFGPPDRIDMAFPDVFMKFDEPLPVFNSTDVIEDLSYMVDGREFGFFLDPDGDIASIRRIAVESTPVNGANKLISESSQKMAAVSAAADAVIVYLPPFQNQVHLFSNGTLLAKYGNGQWRMTDYETLAARLTEIAETDHFNWPAICTSIQAATTLADSGHGGSIALIPETEVEGIEWQDKLSSQFRLHLERPDRQQVDTNLLVSLARLDGAVLLNRHGQLVACNVLFESCKQPDDIKVTGLRHQTAKEFSAGTGSLAVVASRYGTVTLYYKGDEIARI